MSKPGIYQIRNIVNDKIYVGSAVYLKGRRAQHFCHLRNNKHHSYYLQNSFNKYGEKNFIFEILDHVEDKEKLIEREQYYFNTLNPNYNICKIAGSQLGYTFSDEVKERMSVSRKEGLESGKITTWNKGIKTKPRTEDEKERISKTLKGIKRKPFSAEHRKKISDSRVGKSFMTDEGKKVQMGKRKKHPNYKKNIKKLVAAATLAKQKQVKQIDPLTKEVVKVWGSIKEVASFYNVSCCNPIARSNKNNTLYKNYLWKY